MENYLVLALIAFIFSLLFGGGALFYYFRIQSAGRAGTVQALMKQSGMYGSGKSGRAESGREDVDVLKAFAKRKASKNAAPTLEEKFFHAGMFYEEDKIEFRRLKIVAPILTTIAGTYVCSFGGVEIMLAGAIVGCLVGLQIPHSILDRRITRRGEDIMFYLPLVIEQIIIGVSSSLDVGPCLARVVQMADERDTHNSVTELFKHAQLYMRSGVSLDNALTEIGKLSGHTELKHAFMSLAQVAKHGGEITKQLQELADAVGSQREARIEGKIKKLELEATAPVALVFMGYMLILLIGFGQQVMKVFE